MAEILTDDRHYKAIAKKVRDVKGSTDAYLPSDLPAAVLSLGNIQSPLLNAAHAVVYDVDGFPTVRGNKLCCGLYSFMRITSLDLSPYDVIPKGLCDNCYELTQVTFSNSLTHIHDYAFRNCDSFLSPQFPNSLVYIGYRAFEYVGWNGEGMTLVFPSSLKYIGSGAFIYGGVKSIAFNEGLEEIAGNAFWNVDFTQKTITLPRSLKILGNSAFGACAGCTTVTFKGTPESIHEKAFDSNTKITTINVPWAEGAIPGAPWGATKATVKYNVTA